MEGEEFEEGEIHISDEESLSLPVDVLTNRSVSNRSISRGSVNSPRNPSHGKYSNNRLSNKDGETTPLLQSDASSDTSEEENFSTNYSTLQEKTINNNTDSPEVPNMPELPHLLESNPRYRHGSDLYTTVVSPQNRNNNLRSIDSDSECSVNIEDRAISFAGALKIPGVLEFSLCLFFAKLVSYTFLYWLPTFIMDTALNVSCLNYKILSDVISIYLIENIPYAIQKSNKSHFQQVTSEDAAYFSTLFDIGGIAGGILAGIATDYTGKSASVCAIMLVAAIPSLFGYKEVSSSKSL